MRLYLYDEAPVNDHYFVFTPDPNNKEGHTKWDDHGRTDNNCWSIDRAAAFELLSICRINTIKPTEARVHVQDLKGERSDQTDGTANLDHGQRGRRSEGRKRDEGKINSNPEYFPNAERDLKVK